MKRMTLVAALSDFFAPPKINVAEMKALSAEDREYFRRLLTEAGYEIQAAEVR
jgi:hypothetical protein